MPIIEAALSGSSNLASVFLPLLTELFSSDDHSNTFNFGAQSNNSDDDGDISDV